MQRTYSATLIEAIIDTLPAALLLVNHNRRVTEIFVSNRRLRHFQESDLAVLLNRILPAEAIEQILTKFNHTVAANEVTSVCRFSFQTTQGYDEYYACKIVPLPELSKVALIFVNESETALLEQEFNALSEQAECAQRDLCAAISELDFRLMDFDQSNKRLQVLYKVASIIQRDIGEREALEEIIDVVRMEFDCANAAVFLLNKTRDTLVMYAQKGYYSFLNIPVDKGVTGYCARTCELVFVPDVSQDLRYIQGTPDCVSELAIPLIVSNRVIGVLDLEYLSERCFSPFDLDLLRTIAAQAALTIAHVQHVAQIKKMAITDELTGLYNFHHFSALLDQEYRRASRYGHSLSILMIDIDDFKKINDSFGHLVGNEVLAKVAGLIIEQTREVDWVCRYGGEEFAVLLPETTTDEAQSIAERIRSAIAAYSFDHITGQPDQNISVSIGVSGLFFDGIGKRDLIAHADLALFAAKRATKNCVRVYRCEGGEI